MSLGIKNRHIKEINKNKCLNIESKNSSWEVILFFNDIELMFFKQNKDEPDYKIRLSYKHFDELIEFLNDLK
jgi:hypothetical protein